eukprot:6373263-Alexandrium_andersonii.AAC.1
MRVRTSGPGGTGVLPALGAPECAHLNRKATDPGNTLAVGKGARRAPEAPSKGGGGGLKRR